MHVDNEYTEIARRQHDGFFIAFKADMRQVMLIIFAVSG
jgi:hypothetical protein